MLSWLPSRRRCIRSVSDKLSRIQGCARQLRMMHGRGAVGAPMGGLLGRGGRAPRCLGWCRYREKCDRNRGTSNLCDRNHGTSTILFMSLAPTSKWSSNDAARRTKKFPGPLTTSAAVAFSHPFSHRAPQYRVGSGGIECSVAGQMLKIQDQTEQHDTGQDGLDP